MALVWTSLDGPAEQQIQVQASALGSVRMVLLELNPGTSLPDGAFTGQLLMWDGDETNSWIPVPNQGGPTARAEGLRGVNDLAPTSLFLGDGFASLTGSTSQLVTQLSNVIARVIDDSGGGEGEWQMSYSDGETLTQIIGTPTSVTINSYTPAGSIDFLSHGVTQNMSDSWSVVEGEGARFVSLDETVGFLAQVESTIEITLQNTRSQYQMQSDVHVFRNPNLAGVPTNNVFFSSAGDDMTVGFLGTGPAPRQSITGATTQDQVDSLVAALVAFGLVSDDR